jgi:hypothetical protein
MGGSNDWRTQQSGADWMRDIEKRILHEERRPNIATASDLLGPGISPFSVYIQDWNAPETAFNGYFHTEPGSINSPDNSLFWMGTSQATKEGYGVQRVTQYSGTPPETVPTYAWVRLFYTVSGAQRQFTTWKMEEDTDPPYPVIPDPVNEFLGVEIGDAQNLNNYVTPGVFTQSQNVEAASGSNYPIGQAGVLEVNANSNASMIWQRYRVYATATYGDFTYQRSRYNGVWVPWKFMGPDPGLPDPVDTYVGADQNITSTTRGTETPTAVRTSVANPHPVKRMLVRQLAQSWILLGATQGGAVYFDSDFVSGGSNAFAPYGWRTDNITSGQPAYMSALAEGTLWVPALTTLVTKVECARSQSGLTTTIRFTHNSLIPLRYEG